MKKALYLLLLLTFMSCTPFRSPSSSEIEILKQEIQPGKIEELGRHIVSTGTGMIVYASPKGPEALAFLSYIIPLLNSRSSLSLRFWFLENNSDERILSFLKGDLNGPSAEDLLRRADPELCGFEPYRDFLIKLKAYYGELEEEERFKISSSDDVLLDFRLYNGDFLRDDERSVYLIHSPLREGRHWEFPFEGILYAMMIQEWPLQNYGYIRVEKNSLGSSFLTSRDAGEERLASERIDGLILMSYPEEYFPMKRIDSFVNEENIAEVLDFFPRQLIREKTKPASYLVNRKIDARHRKATRKLGRLYEAVREEIPGYIED